MSEYFGRDERAEIITEDGDLKIWRAAPPADPVGVYLVDGEKLLRELEKKNPATVYARFCGDFWDFLEWVDGDGILILPTADPEKWHNLAVEYNRAGGADIWGAMCAAEIRQVWRDHLAAME